MGAGRRFLKFIPDHWICAAAIFLLFSVPSARAEQKIDQALHEFVSNYVDAVDRNDLDALKSLILPESLKQITKDNEDYFDYMFHNDLKESIPADYKLSVERITDEEAAVFTDTFDYTVPPTHLMIIEFDASETRAVTIIRQIVQQNGARRLVLPAPKAEMLTAFRQRRVKEKAEEKKAYEQYMKLDEVFKFELETVLDHGDRVGAYKLYSERTGADMGLARMVVALLSGEREYKLEKKDNFYDAFINAR